MSLKLHRFKKMGQITFREKIYFETGLYGFEGYSVFFLVGKQNEEPFLWLEAKEADISFAVIDPFLICPEYDPDLTQEDLSDDGDYILLAIVNLNDRPHTVNLSAPILIHWKDKKGKQILVSDNPAYLLNKK